MSYTYEHGSGTEQDPYQVWTAEDLDGVRDHLTAYFIQMSDIDLSIYNWDPIGKMTSYKEFEGYYNGNNFKVSNLRVDNFPLGFNYNYRGLFGVTWGATIENITIENVFIEEDEFGDSGRCGALVGYAANHTVIKNCKIKNGVIYSQSFGGGLVGLAYATIEDCMVENVVVYGDYLAGVFAGEADGNISRCGAKGKVILCSYDIDYANAELGGFIAGYDGGTMENCYFNGELVASGYDVYNWNGIGGFASYLYGNIINCYSACRMQVDLTGEPIVHGFVGYDGTDAITSSYYDMSLAGFEDGSSVIPKTTAEMTYPYSDPENVYIEWAFYDESKGNPALTQFQRRDSVPFIYFFMPSVPKIKIYNNKIYYLWSEQVDGRAQIFTAESNLDGSNWIATQRTTETSSTNGSYAESFDIADDVMYFIFLRDWKIITASMDMDTFNWVETERTTTGRINSYEQFPNLKVHGDKIYYFYSGGRYTTIFEKGLWFASSNLDGSGWSTSLKSTGDIYYVDFRILNGVIYLVYEKDNEIYTASVNIDGTNWSETQRTNFGSEDKDLYYTRMEIVDGKIYYIFNVYADFEETSDWTEHIYLATTNLDGTGWQIERKTFGDWYYDIPEFYYSPEKRGFYLVTSKNTLAWDGCKLAIKFFGLNGSDFEEIYESTLQENTIFTSNLVFYEEKLHLIWRKKEGGTANNYYLYTGIMEFPIWKHDVDYSMNDGYPYFYWQPVLIIPKVIKFLFKVPKLIQV